MGRINTGGSKKRTGDNIALASSVSGTTLKLTPPKGYYDGVTGNNVTIGDADFIAANIKNGINIFGLVGASTDKRTATGVTASGATGQLTISGLPFRPKVIILNLQTTTATNQQQSVAVFDSGFPFYNGNTGYVFGITNVSGTITSYTSAGATTNPVTSGGVVLENLRPSVNFTWVAYE